MTASSSNKRLSNNKRQNCANVFYSFKSSSITRNLSPAKKGIFYLPLIPNCFFLSLIIITACVLYVGLFYFKNILFYQKNIVSLC